MDDFHNQQNICIECNGLGFKRVKAPYKRSYRWYNDCYDKFKCKKNAVVLANIQIEIYGGGFMYEIPEVKSLRWLSNMFPFVENPKDETDRMSNAIHIYCSAGADKIEELVKKLEWLLPIGEWTIEGADAPDFGVSDDN